MFLKWLGNCGAKKSGMVGQNTRLPDAPGAVTFCYFILKIINLRDDI